MEMTFPSVDPMQLYRQWQDGKILDNDERMALRPDGHAEAGSSSFSDVLKSLSERDS